jgi:glycine/D-amino acid oxidase-like deaminating enzyme
MAIKNIVVVGGGIQGTSVAYHLAERTKPSDVSITLLEAKVPAAAASGKGGGFMARSWGNGDATEQLHHVAFDMYETMALKLGCTSYRKLPVLSVTPGLDGLRQAQKDKKVRDFIPGWLDGTVGRVSALGKGDDTAQITPAEFVDKMLEKHRKRIKLVLGTCQGVVTDQGSEPERRKVTAIRYTDKTTGEDSILPCDAVIVSAGPWSCAAEDWFPGELELPMEGIKSTSIVWKRPKDKDVDATALFCADDRRFGTHLEVYPRPNGEIYICGIGGSDYISKEDLKEGAFRQVCEADDARVDAAKNAFGEMSTLYKQDGELETTQACMRPCPPDAKPYMGKIPGVEGAYINAGHNCW